MPKDPKYATCHKVTPELMAASVTPPGVAAPAAATMPVPKNPIPATRNYEVCNDYGEAERERKREKKVFKRKKERKSSLSLLKKKNKKK